MSIDYCLQRARELPYIRGQQRHFAAVFCKRGRLVSESANSYLKTSPRAFKAASKLGLNDKCYIHAEMRALWLDKKQKGVKLIVVRIGAKGDPMYSEPCLVCKEVLKDFSNIKFVEYTT